ncbi:5-carboxymethyl-2-hydroxymuconate Delta-isomerase [Kribbella shirazensis]|uniref:5-carboxymethyl-2-hydroxymuconate isomerase n=1 Tax=Kribbella shirazensis TaxID=1105143 RepID=A0A7X5V6N6_9ACTN|nr:isomerase [Kribbella shirazensis]NIK55349.1 5-carboxymethyl-2-hydroxymuconate isomerase [Kribbella shirazensis]
MPQITVDYSHPVEDAFDVDGFTRVLHETVVDIAAAKPEACKTLIRYDCLSAYGYDDRADEGHALVHVTIGLLPGRTEETKARLTEATVELLRKHIAPQDGVTVHASAEVRELDASYRKLEW